MKNVNTSAVQSWDIAKSKKLQETPLKAQLSTQNDFGHVPAPIVLDKIHEVEEIRVLRNKQIICKPSY